MMARIIRTILSCMFIVGVTAGLVTMARASPGTDADPPATWGWSANAGWIDFDPPDGGMRVCADHLEGYAWGENVGWINLDPPEGGVRIDPVTGAFSGYAWSETIGWIKFSSAAPVPYRVAMLLHRVYLPLVMNGT